MSQSASKPFLCHTYQWLVDFGPQNLLSHCSGERQWENEVFRCVYEFLGAIEASKVPQATAICPQITRLPAYVCGHVIVPQYPPKNSMIEQLWRQTTSDLDVASPGFEKFKSLQNLHLTPLYNSSYDRFRALGFSIWDLEKLVRLGLMRLPQELQPPKVFKAYWVGPCNMDGGPRMFDLFYRWGSFATEAAQYDTAEG